MTLPLLPQDKANHVIYGAAVALTVMAAATFARTHGIDFLAPRHIGLAAAVLTGAIKELTDYVLNREAIAAGLPPPHGVEWNDFFATSAGGLLAWGCASV